MKFQERIKIAIKNSEFSQKEIAEMLHIRESNISNWKKGIGMPSIEILYSLCIILDESADWLLGLDKETNAKNINQTFNFKF